MSRPWVGKDHLCHNVGWPWLRPRAASNRGLSPRRYYSVTFGASGMLDEAAPTTRWMVSPAGVTRHSDRPKRALFDLRLDLGPADHPTGEAHASAARGAALDHKSASILMHAAQAVTDLERVAFAVGNEPPLSQLGLSKAAPTSLRVRFARMIRCATWPPSPDMLARSPGWATRQPA